MREIELKFRVKEYKMLLEKLQNFGCKIEEPIIQNDTIYVANLENTESTEGSLWLRVRKENQKIEMNLKKQSAKKEESQEIEFEVSSYEKARAFLETLGYKKWVIVNKKRSYSKYLQYNLCIDEVERLGNFIEIELLVEDYDTKDYLEDLYDVAGKLGLDKEDVVRSHYDTMIADLDYEQKNEI